MISKLATKNNTTLNAEQILQDLDSSRTDIADNVKEHFQEAFIDAMETLRNYGEAIEVIIQSVF